MLGIDFIGPLPMTPLGNSMILTVTDLFSKWTEAFALPDKRATSVAASLVKLFCNKGITMAVLSDNGSEFCNEVWLLQLRQIWLVRILHSWFFTKYYKKNNIKIHWKILPKNFVINVFAYMLKIKTWRVSQKTDGKVWTLPLHNGSIETPIIG